MEINEIEKKNDDLCKQYDDACKAKNWELASQLSMEISDLMDLLPDREIKIKTEKVIH